jgi:hypothetical protein
VDFCGGLVGFVRMEFGAGALQDSIMRSKVKKI